MNLFDSNISEVRDELVEPHLITAAVADEDIPSGLGFSLLNSSRNYRRRFRWKQSHRIHLDRYG
jgi:hypothetical protein